MSDPINPNAPELPADKPASEPVAATDKPAESPAAAVASEKPPAAAKPAAPAKSTAATDKQRRNFLLTTGLALFGSWFAIAWMALTASMLGFVLGTIRFLFPNVLSEPPSKFKIGDKSQFDDGKVNERFKPQGAWIVRYQGEIYALSTTCTHLGCTPNWLEAEQKFKCPCHGSGFKITGVNFEGPAPRPLERWALSVGDDGQLVVDKSKKFQKELGQWTNPEAFVKV